MYPTQCHYCKTFADPEQHWIGDEGLICNDCYDIHYAKKKAKDGHWHNWTRYVGFTDEYDYCECGEKRYVKN